MSYTPSLHDDRLDIFASVKNDPEVWDLVQKKYHQFEDLHRDLKNNESERRRLLSRLSEVNDAISDLQKQLMALSGRKFELDEDAAEGKLAAALAEESVEPVKEEASVIEEPGQIENEPADPEEDEPVVGLAPLVEATDEPVAEESAMPWPEVATVENKDVQADAAESRTSENPEQPTAESESVAPEPAESDASSAPTHSASVLSFAQPAAEESASPTTQPASETPVEVVEEKPVQPAPLEVQELQRIFDEAPNDRRKSDSALKLVELYDGKAEVFFAAMTRSHQQSGLSEDDARKEAVKDVQTMIATAKAHAEKSSSTPAKSESKDKNSGGVRRLFSH